MKLLLLSLQRHGGGALDSLGFSNGLCDNGFSHDIVIADGNERAADFTDNAYRRVTKLPTYRGMGDFIVRSIFFARPLRLWRVIAETEPDIVQITHFHPWAAIAFLARPFHKYRIVYGVHEDPYARKDTTNPWIMGVLERSFVKRADIVATYSDYMAGVLAARVPGKHIYAMRLGAYEYFCANFSHRANDDKGPLKLLFFGPVKEYKGVDTLVVAMELCRRNGVNAVLTIAGKQSPGARILDPAAVAAMGIRWENRYVPDEEVCRFMEEADVMMIPYKEATQTTPGALALAYGIPAIATRTGGLPEQVIDGVNGLLAEPGDAEGIAGAIGKIANDRKLLGTFAAGARDLRERKFSWKVITKELIANVYER